MDKQFEEFKPMIWSIVSLKASAYKSFDGIDSYSLAEELYGEACLAYVKAINSWDENEGVKLSTWIYSQVDYAVRNYLARKVYPEASVVKTDVAEDMLSDESESIISEEKSNLITDLYDMAIDKWGYEKTKYLYFIVAFDETLSYNKNFGNFFNLYAKEMDLDGLVLDNNDTNNAIKAHKFYWSKINKDSSVHKKMHNNVRNSIKYYIKNQNK